MRIIAMIVMVVLTAISARAEQGERRITVCLEKGGELPGPMEMQTRQLAGQMFARIGVKIDWHTSCQKKKPLERDTVIVVTFTDRAPIEDHSGALAFAYPFEGVHITVFLDRVHRTVQSNLTTALLAHVIVHEITHILEGTSRHSESGIMKARWTGVDYINMAAKPLPFAPIDILLINRATTLSTGM